MSTAIAGERTRRARWGRVVVATAIVSVTALSATYAGATWSKSASVSQGALTAGALSLTMANGDASEAFTLSITGLYPGATATRAVDLTLGSAGFKTLGVLVNTDCGGCNRSALDTTGDLKLTVDRCAAAWSASGSSPSRSYTCGGGSVNVLAQTSLLSIENDAGAGLAPGTTSLTTNSTLSGGAVDHYVFTFTLPSSASSSDQSASSVYKFTFQGTQRDAARQ